MIYEFLKIIHILSACLLFGTGLGTASFMYLAHRTNDTHIIASTYKQIVKGDWYFTLPSGIIQLVTGLWMVFIHPYSLTDFWLWGSLLGYFIAGLCWVPVVYWQIQLRDMAIKADQQSRPLPPSYNSKFRKWFILGWPAFISLIIVFYLMANRPIFLF